MHVFAVPFPIFDASSKAHRRLADLAERAEEVARARELDPGWQFQKARRITREALAADGVSSAIDALVEELLVADGD